MKGEAQQALLEEVGLHLASGEIEEGPGLAARRIGVALLAHLQREERVEVGHPTFAATFTGESCRARASTGPQFGC